MTVGKPNFNLNSFGIKYLSKDEVQEFLQKLDINPELQEHGKKDEGVKSTGKVLNAKRQVDGKRLPTTLGSARAGDTKRDRSIKPINPRNPKAKPPQMGANTATNNPEANFDRKHDTYVHEQELLNRKIPKGEPTDSRINDINTGNKLTNTPPNKLEGGTRSVFTARDKLPSKMSNLEASKRRDIESSPKTRLNDRGETVQVGNHKVDESGVVGRQHRQQPQPTTKPNEGVKSRTRQQVGGIISDREYSKEGEGKKMQLDSNSRFDKKTGKPIKLTESKARLASGQTNTNSEGKKKKKHKMSTTSTKLDSKQETHTAGDAPEGVEHETQNIGGSNVEVGVGVDAHKKFKEVEGQGGLRRAQRVRSGTGHEGKNIGRGKGKRKDSNLNDQSKTSKNAKAHDTRGRKYKWENDDDKAGYNAIKQVKHSKTGEMVNDRVAQRKYLNSMDEKYKRSVTEQPKRSTAGQKIIDEMSKKKKKSNDIIIDMNIIKLDLMKGKKYLKRERLGSVIGKPKNVTNDGVADYEKGDDKDFFSLDDKALKSQADETILKVKSLKLDLMKFDGIYIDSTDPSGTYHPKPKPKTKPAEAKSEKDVKPKNLNEVLLGLIDTKPFKGNMNIYTKPSPKSALGKSAAETIFKAISLKLDLMKSEEIDDGNWDDPDYDNVGQEAYNDYMAEQREKLEDTGQSEAQRINFLKPSKPTKGVPTALPKKLGKSADETIFNAISLKLDLMKVSSFKKPAKIKRVKANGETFEEEGERVMDEHLSQEIEDNHNEEIREQLQG